VPHLREGPTMSAAQFAPANKSVIMPQL
jgi:hypothetical protein